MPDTLNIKQFGAVGDGVTDDTAAIQEALDTNVLTNNGYFTTNTRGGVFAPPGLYRITSPLHLWGTKGMTDPTQWIQGQGRIFAHRNSATFTADFNGFILDNENPDSHGDGSTRSNSMYGIIEGINFVNMHCNPLSAGCVRLQCNEFTVVRECSFRGANGLLLGGGKRELSTNNQTAFESTVQNCQFNGIDVEHAWSLGIGCGAGHHTRVIGNRFELWNHALVLGGAQAAAYSNHFEVNNVAITTGALNDLTAFFNAGGVILNSAFESNEIDILIRTASGLTIDGVTSQGGSGSHVAQAALKYEDGSNIWIRNWCAGGEYDVSPVWIAGGGPTDGRNGIHFDGCSVGGGPQGYESLRVEPGVSVGAHWTEASSFYFTPTFADLPPFQIPNIRRICSDAQQQLGVDVWGTVITGSGANTVPVFQGTDGQWRLG